MRQIRLFANYSIPLVWGIVGLVVGCVGAHFALVEATLALARIIGAFRVGLIDKEPVMPVGVVTTQPDRSPMFRVSPR